MKTNSWTTVANLKTYRQAQTYWLKFYEEAVIESEARTPVVHDLHDCFEIRFRNITCN